MEFRNINSHLQSQKPTSIKYLFMQNEVEFLQSLNAYPHNDEHCEGVEKDDKMQMNNHRKSPTPTIPKVVKQK